VSGWFEVVERTGCATRTIRVLPNYAYLATPYTPDVENQVGRRRVFTVNGAVLEGAGVNFVDEGVQSSRTIADRIGEGGAIVFMDAPAWDPTATHVPCRHIAVTPLMRLAAMGAVEVTIGRHWLTGYQENGSSVGVWIG
jgi:hypothetical protein